MSTKSNERKTEEIVRRHFRDYDSVVIEEQLSDNPRIRNLLQRASKQGQGQGRPEFIISMPSHPELLIVIECKAHVKNHASTTLSQPAGYAVDGALHYAAHLSRHYDVIAIGVSGNNARNARVSTYLHLKGGAKAELIKLSEDKLHSPEDYYRAYIEDPRKFNQDYRNLLVFSTRLNTRLEEFKIAESRRGLLISGILIALNDKNFSDTCRERKASDLNKKLLKTVIKELRGSNIKSSKLKTLKTEYQFIEEDTSLKSGNVLLSLIQEIDTEVNGFRKTHKFFDVIGTFYIEFLKYANHEKGLGIVLTPPHITKFFCEIAKVNKNSRVYDNCTGTGGFLISALRIMVDNAGGDSRLERNIKSKQIFGVEYQASKYALAVANMHIHGDGRTHIQVGDCFKNKNWARARRPNICLLNPPYKTKKVTGTQANSIEELEFVVNGIECLTPGGVCVALLPMRCALQTKGSIGEIKRRLLKDHTLEAVFSLPDELFFNSDTNVVPCAMVFTAHNPHPSAKKTFFGYFKNDGFIKRKIEGRFDMNNEWGEISKNWLNLFENRVQKPGISVCRKVNEEDEWCAEAYMETDYNNLSVMDFETSILEHTVFLHRYRLLGRNNKGKN